MRRLPTWNVRSVAGTSFRNATFGLSGPRDSASPMRTLITIG
jgi:hypothetical protein